MNNSKNKLAAVLLALLLVCAACSAEEKADFSNSKVVGLITEIDGSKVTLQLGELVEQEPPAKPEGAAGSEPPANKPDSAPGGLEPPAKPEESGQNESKPTMQLQNSGSAQALIIPQVAEGGKQPDMLTLDNESVNSLPEAPAGGKPNSLYSFKAGQESATFDLDGAEVSVEEPMQTRAGSLAELAAGDILELEIGEKNRVLTVTVKNSGSTSMGGTVEQGTSANLLAEDGIVTGQTYTSSGDDENALRVDSAFVSLVEAEVQKTDGASSSTESGDFYGQNAALLATNGAMLTIDKSKITSNAPNGNGVFSYGDGTVVSISDSSIVTSGNNSGGLQTTGGATMNAVNLSIETAGNSSAAIRSDRGGGTVNVIGGNYISRGYNSPAVYSTADITVMNANLNAENSEALVIEGRNSIKLLDCTVSGRMSLDKGASSDENLHNVMIYQSMSGDAEVGTSEFSAQGGSITGQSGDLFYVTNTHCLLTLDDVALDNQAEGQLLRVCGNSARHGWGKAGSNGAQVEFLAKHQQMQGEITVDSISSLDLQLTEGSVFTGTLNIVPNAQGGNDGSVALNVVIDADSVWNLTGDCVISSLENKGTINYNGYKISTTG